MKDRGSRTCTVPPSYRYDVITHESNVEHKNHMEVVQTQQDSPHKRRNNNKFFKCLTRGGNVTMISEKMHSEIMTENGMP